jgi:hypothetical protein
MGAALMALIGLGAMVALVQIGLTRPGLSAWIRVLDLVLGLGFGAGCIWFGLAMRRAFRSRSGYLELHGDSIVLYDSGLFDGPWEIPVELLRGALIDRSPTRGLMLLPGNVKRFPVSGGDGGKTQATLARWLFSNQGGSPLPTLGGKQVPNVAIIFRRPATFARLRRRGGLTVFFTEYGLAGGDRPLPDTEYGGVLVALDDIETFSRYLRDRDLLLDHVSTADALRLGATLERERGRRGQVFFVLGVMVILLIIRFRLMSW